ncbi:MAG: homoserine kinase [Chitinophagales bacterium]
MKKVSVLSPATVANIVCGFDIMGFAVDQPSDKITVRLLDKKQVRIINKDNYNLPTEPTKNVFGGALLAMMNAVNEEIGFEVESTKVIKPGSGIGSSAASAAGVVVAANHLLGNRFTKMELVRFAMYGEQIASQAWHADNIAPCIYGGVTLIRSNEPLDITSLNFPPLHVTIIHPQIEVKTSYAREILPKQVALKDAVTQWANVAGLVAGFMKEDYELISRSLKDILIEPVRSKLIPAFDELKKQCMEAGALGGGISGSGPSVFMLSKDEATAKKVEQAMNDVYRKTGIDFNVYVTKVNNEGVEIVN